VQFKGNARILAADEEGAAEKFGVYCGHAVCGKPPMERAGLAPHLASQFAFSAFVQVDG